MARASATLLGLVLAAVAAGLAACGDVEAPQTVEIEPSSGKTGTRVQVTGLPECDGQHDVSLEAVGSEQGHARIKNGTGTIPTHGEATRYEVVLYCTPVEPAPENSDSAGGVKPVGPTQKTRTGTFFDVQVEPACRTRSSIEALPRNRDCSGLQVVAEGEKCDQTFSSAAGVSPPQSGGPWAEAKHLKCFGEKWRTADWVRATMRARLARERKQEREAERNYAPIPGSACTPGEDLPPGYTCVPGSPTFP